MTISINSSVLLGYYNAKEGITAAATSGSSTSSTSASATQAPTAPWQAKNASSQASLLATQVLDGQSIINPNAAQLDVKGASSDYQSLFAIYKGLNALDGLAADLLKSAGSNTTVSTTSQAAKAFTTGLGQVSTYVEGLSLQHMRLTTGLVQSSDSTTAGPQGQNTSYTTGVVFAGGLNDVVPAFEGDVQFSINVTDYSGSTTAIPIDLSQMGSTDRTMPNVVNYINSQLKAAGVVTRFATSSQPGVSQTVTVNGKPVALSAGPTQWSFQINGDTSEKVSFSAPASSDAVYVSQTSGNVTAYNAQKAAAASATALATETGTKASAASTAITVTAPVQQLVKLQTDTSTTAAAPPTAAPLPGTTNASADEAYAKSLNPNIASVGATATGSDGSLYVLANVTGTINGDTVQSSQNVALQKYDSAGNLIYSTTIGSAGTANGLSLAVAADGSVAIGGSVTGALSPTEAGNGATTADSFVALYNSSGVQQWATTATSPTNNQVNAVAFGAKDAVYVAGQTNAPSATSPSYGSPAGYLAGYSATGAATFNIKTGTTDASSLAVDGSTVVVGGESAGDGVVNSYAVPASGAPTLNASRDIGALGSGSVAGVAIDNGQVVVAGTTTNAALNAGTVTSAFSGSQDAFVAQLSENLTPSATDAVAYYGGAGSTSATALTVSDGQIYIAGASTGGLPGLATDGKQEGYVADIDVAAGQATWSQALTGQDGYDAPKTLAVANDGASVLDRLGLPTQTLQYTSSQLLTASTSVSAGDQFSIRTQSGVTGGTVTIAATDTPASLAQKIQKASGFQVNVSVVSSGGKQEVKITPEFPGEVIELQPGPAGKDALGPLGLSAGIVQTAPAIPTAPKVIPGVTSASSSSSSSSSSTKDTYGLNIAQDFNLTTVAGVAAAQKAIVAAMGQVQTAYNNLVAASQPASTKPAVTGTVPAYLTAELANYQEGLQRLTGGSSSSTSSSSSSSSLGAGLASLLS